MIKPLLRKFLGKKYPMFVKIYWRIISVLYPLFFKRDRVLVYAGINIGDSFQKIHFKYKKVIGFEPNPENFKKLNFYNTSKRIDIYNYALSNRRGIFKFHLPDNKNNDASASLSDFIPKNRYQTKTIIDVETINLCAFLKDLGIEFIDFYISDIEGYDYTVLKTLEKEFIKTKKILKIQVEAVNNNEENPYISVSNFENDFDNLLQNNYKKTGRGSGFVNDGDNFSGKTLDLLYLKKD